VFDRVVCATLLLLGGTSPLLGQQSAPRLRPSTCQLADSLLGPPTTPQQSTHLLGWYSRAVDRSFVRTDNASLASSGIGASLGWMGRADGLPSSAQLEPSVPAVLLVRPIDAADTLWLLLDDTLRIPLSGLRAPILQGERLPPFAPVLAPLSRSDLLALGGASAAVAAFREIRVTASSSGLAALNALVRIALCGAVLPEH
jgi:hypothetical protein